MIEHALYPKLSTYAALNKTDIVLDAGAGFGFLSRYLANKCKTIVAVEKDKQVATVLRNQVKDIDNIIVIEGDVLKANLPAFNKVVSIPPYYLSSHLIMWLLEREIDCAVLILQKEFASRLVAPIGSENYGWLTVISKQYAEAELLDEVPKTMFYPQPEVDSQIIKLKFCTKKPFEVKNQEFFKQMSKWLFSQRNKKLSKALGPFLKTKLKLTKQDAEKLVFTLPFIDRRARELTPAEFGELANAISN